MMKWNETAYGVDIQGDTAVLVRATVLRGKLAFTSCGLEEVTRAGTGSDQVALAAAMPPRRSITQQIEAPYTSRRKAMKVFPTILDIQLPFALEECVYDLLRVSRSDDRGGLTSLAVVARKTDVSDAIQTFQSRGFDATSLDHEGLALWEQSLREEPVTSAEVAMPRIIIYLGVDRITVAIGEGETYQNSHGVNMGNHAHIHRLIRSAVGAEGQAVRWMWAGPGVVDQQSFQQLERLLLAKWPGSSTCHDDPATFLARGLAARILVPGATACNMRAGVFAHSSVAHKRGRQIMQAAGVAFAAGLMLCAFSIAALIWTSHSVRLFDEQFAKKAESLLGHPLDAKGSDALTQIRRRAEERRAELEPFMRSFRPSLTVLLYELLAAGKESGMQFDKLSLGENNVVVKGKLGIPDRESAISEVLERHGYRPKLEIDSAEAGGKKSIAVTAMVIHE